MTWIDWLMVIGWSSILFTGNWFEQRARTKRFEKQIEERTAISPLMIVATEAVEAFARVERILSKPKKVNVRLLILATTNNGEAMIYGREYNLNPDEIHHDVLKPLVDLQKGAMIIAWGGTISNPICGVYACTFLDSRCSLIRVPEPLRISSQLQWDIIADSQVSS